MNLNVFWGTRYWESAQARCVSAYTQSPLASAPGSFTTNVPTPATPTVSVPSSAYAGTWFRVTTSNTCIAGTTPHYDVWTSGSGTHWGSGSFSDYWPSAGVRTYYGQIWCSGPNASSSRSGTGQDSISIVNPPPPAAPTGVSAQWSISPTGGGSIQGYFNSSSGATSYEYGGRFVISGVFTGWTSAVRGWSGYVNVANSNCPDGTTMTGGQFRVRAGNSNGWSGYVTVWVNNGTAEPVCNY